MKDEREDDGFDASHEGGDAEVDVVVGCRVSWLEELAVEEVEDELQMVSTTDW